MPTVGGLEGFYSDTRPLYMHVEGWLTTNDRNGPTGTYSRRVRGKVKTVHLVFENGLLFKLLWLHTKTQAVGRNAGIQGVVVGGRHRLRGICLVRMVWSISAVKAWIPS